jgi:hypothetical protein
LEAFLDNKDLLVGKFTGCTQLKVRSDTGFGQLATSRSWVYFLDSGSLLKFKSVVHMCEKVGGKRPDFWPLAKALAAVFTLICSFINAAGQAEAACAAALENTASNAFLLAHCSYVGLKI